MAQRTCAGPQVRVRLERAGPEVRH
jgi:hypothetical protein